MVTFVIVWIYCFLIDCGLRYLLLLVVLLELFCALWTGLVVSLSGFWGGFVDVLIVCYLGKQVLLRALVWLCLLVWLDVFVCWVWVFIIWFVFVGIISDLVWCLLFVAWFYCRFVMYLWVALMIVCVLCVVCVLFDYLLLVYRFWFVALCFIRV